MKYNASSIKSPAYAETKQKEWLYYVYNLHLKHHCMTVFFKVLHLVS